jgi:hypothetical protein
MRRLCTTVWLALGALIWSAGQAEAQVTPTEGGVYPVGTVVTGPCAYLSQPPNGTDVGAGAQHVHEDTWTVFRTDPGGGVIGDVWPSTRGCITRGEPHDQGNVGVITLHKPGRYTMSIADSRYVSVCERERCTVGSAGGWRADPAGSHERYQVVRFSAAVPVDQPPGTDQLYGSQYFTAEDRELFDSAGGYANRISTQWNRTAVGIELLALAFAVRAPSVLSLHGIVAASLGVSGLIAAAAGDIVGGYAADLDLLGKKPLPFAVGARVGGAARETRLPRLRPIPGVLRRRDVRHLRAYLRGEHARAAAASRLRTAFAAADEAALRGDTDRAARHEADAAGAAVALARRLETVSVRRRAQRVLDRMRRTVIRNAGPEALLVAGRRARRGLPGIARRRLVRRGISRSELRRAERAVKRSASRPRRLLLIPRLDSRVVVRTEREAAARLRALAVRIESG